jgi:UPF0755 protein
VKPSISARYDDKKTIKKRNMRSKILSTVFDIAILIIFSLAFYLTSHINSSKVVFIPSGSVKKIVSYLGNNNFNVGPIETALIPFFGHPQSGWIEMGASEVSRFDFLYKLTHQKAALVEITLIPGETKEIFFELLAKNLSLDSNRLHAHYDKIAPYPDGVILPNSYSVPMGINERHLIYYLVNTSLNTHQKLSKKIFNEYIEQKWFKYLTIASIIQKEAYNEKEMPLVSSVIYNRLEKKMKLQMDGVLNYGIYSHQKITKQRILNDTSHFNTYKHSGIPPYPVCAVSNEAIKAAIFPAKTDYLYFMKSKDGSHMFTKSYKKHLTNISSVKK